MATSRLRVWAPDATYQDFDLFVLEAHDNDSTRVVQDRLGLRHSITPADSDEEQAWSIYGELAIPARTAHQLSSGGLPLNQWLDLHARQAKSEFIFFLDLYGRDTAGNVLHEEKYLTSKLGKLPAWLTGSRTGISGSIPRSLTLTLIAITDEGTFSDFDSVASITSRGARPV